MFRTPSRTFERWTVALAASAAFVLFAAASTSMAAPNATKSTTQASTTIAGTWALTGSMSTPRFVHTATLLQNGKVLVAGGEDASGNVLASSELFNPATGQWTATGSLNVAREWASAVLLPDGKVLVAAGRASTWQDLTSAELYDPATGTWSLTGSLSTPRFDFEMQLLPDGTVLAFGGYQQNTYGVTATAELYDPTAGTWSDATSMNATRGDPISTVLQDGRVLAAGGCAYGGCPGPIDATAQLFDPSAMSWSLTSNPNEPRSSTTMVTLRDGRAFVPGGSSYSGYYWHPTSTVEAYNPASDQWSVLAPLASPVDTPIVAALPDGRALVAGGAYYGQKFATSELYDPTSNTWQNTGGLKVPRQLAATVILTDGRVLATGGLGSDSAVSSAEIFTLGGEAGPPQASFSYYPTDASVFDTIQFYDQSSDPDLGMPIASWSWNFGDGATSSDAYPTHKYAKDGTYTVTLTVKTSDNRSGSTTQSVQVRTHDVSIVYSSVPSKARVGRPISVQVGISNTHYTETVTVDFYKMTPNYGSEYVGSVTKSVPAMQKKQTVMFSVNYTPTDADGAAGKFNFQMNAWIQGAREAYTGDNSVVTTATIVTR